MFSKISLIIKVDLTYSHISDIAVTNKYAMLILGLKICFVFNVELLIITDVRQIIENLKFEVYVYMDKVFFHGNE